MLTRTGARTARWALLIRKAAWRSWRRERRKFAAGKAARRRERHTLGQIWRSLTIRWEWGKGHALAAGRRWTAGTLAWVHAKGWRRHSWEAWECVRES